MQDGGMPQLGCVKSCCKDYFEKGFSKKRVVSLGILDSKENKNYLHKCIDSFKLVGANTLFHTFHKLFTQPFKIINFV